MSQKNTTTRKKSTRAKSTQNSSNEAVDFSPITSVSSRRNGESPLPMLPEDPAIKSARSDSSRQLLDDCKWLLGLVVMIFITAILWSFHMGDPSWSRSISADGAVQNWGDVFGAYLSDVLYYLFGLSAWWIVIAMVIGLYRTFRPFAERSKYAYHGKFAVFGLLLMLVCGSVLEFYTFHHTMENALPLGAGGWFGSMLATIFNQLLGFIFSVLIFFVLALVALSLIIQISWLDCVEHIGGTLARTTNRLIRAIVGDDSCPQNAQPQTTNQEKSNTLSEITPSILKPKHRGMKITVAHQAKKKSGEINMIPAHHEGGYRLPDLSCLKTQNEMQPSVNQAQLRETGELIKTKLAEFGIHVKVVHAIRGPVITCFEIQPDKGVKGSQIVHLSKDLARALSIQSVRVVETISGKNTMGIEVPNEIRQEVLLEEIINTNVFTKESSKLAVALGQDISGLPVVGDLAKMPHLLVGGMTGSGKSVGVNAMIVSILYKAKPEDVRFIMIDPKMLELSVYNGIAHLLCPVVTDMREAGHALNWCVAEMEKRYRLLSHLGVRHLAGYNEKLQAAQNEGKTIPNPFSLNADDPEPLEKLPQIVVVIDELADLMMMEKKTVETQIARLAQKARAAGIHMIIATQRPSVDVITGLIKANVPTRMAFTVQSRIDSRTILDQMGAEDLLKQGDLLFLQPGSAEPQRLQGAFVSDEEVHQVVSFIKEQAQPNYVAGLLTGEAAGETNRFIQPESVSQRSDELFDQAMQFVLSNRKASISSLQRHFRIGYNRAANLMQELEDEGIVSPAQIDGKRTVLMNRLPESSQ